MNIRRLLPTDLVHAYQCPCGAIMPPRDEFSHKVQCKNPGSNSGQHIAVAHPNLAVLHTSRFPVVIEGLETPDELAAMAAVECPYPPAVTVSESGILVDAKD